jgi:hypothetical protein
MNGLESLLGMVLTEAIEGNNPQGVCHLVENFSPVAEPINKHDFPPKKTNPVSIISFPFEIRNSILKS